MWPIPSLLCWVALLRYLPLCPDHAHLFSLSTVNSSHTSPPMSPQMKIMINFFLLRMNLACQRKGPLVWNQCCQWCRSYQFIVDRAHTEESLFPFHFSPCQITSPDPCLKCSLKEKLPQIRNRFSVTYNMSTWVDCASNMISVWNGLSNMVTIWAIWLIW